jgi:hypothetical protein
MTNRCNHFHPPDRCGVSNNNVESGTSPCCQSMLVIHMAVRHTNISVDACPIAGSLSNDRTRARKICKKNAIRKNAQCVHIRWRVLVRLRRSRHELHYAAYEFAIYKNELGQALFRMMANNRRHTPSNASHPAQCLSRFSILPKVQTH